MASIADVRVIYFEAEAKVSNRPKADIGDRLPICHAATILWSLTALIKLNLPKDGDGKPGIGDELLMNSIVSELTRLPTRAGWFAKIFT